MVLVNLQELLFNVVCVTVKANCFTIKLLQSKKSYYSAVS